MKVDFDKSMLNTKLEIQEQTFQSISREIHDNINLSLTLAKLNLNTLSLKNLSVASEKIASSIEFISKAIRDLSDISRSMNSEVINEQGLIRALEFETEKLKALNWFKVETTITGNPVFMDPQKELFIFRIVQEAFNNILKHAHASRIRLQLHYEKDIVDIWVEDDGDGFDQSFIKGKDSKKISAGLLNMQKRAELLNGHYSLESTPGKGTKINILIPY
ncbi:MAG: hypothetical protein IPP73_05450 [Chitinophagaceae bacterium]|nr:hypothetical protein [Chitinophagaceae bacterium]